MVAGLTIPFVVLVLALTAAAYYVVRSYRRACNEEINRLKEAHAQELERLLSLQREQQHHAAALLSAAQSQMRFQQTQQPERTVTLPHADPIAWFKRQQEREAQAEQMRSRMGPDSYILAGAPMIAPSKPSKPSNNKGDES
jgi:biopolymer transport protein ExbB/TolQ